MHFHNILFKIDNYTFIVLAIIVPALGVGASKYFGVRRMFALIFPNFAEKFLCEFRLQIISYKDHEDLFL